LIVRASFLLVDFNEYKCD